MLLFQAWADVIEPLAVQGPSRGGDDADAYRLARAAIYRDRFRRIVHETGEILRGHLGPTDSSEDVLPRMAAGPGAAVAVLLQRTLIEAFTVEPAPGRDVPA